MRAGSVFRSLVLTMCLLTGTAVQAAEVRDPLRPPGAQARTAGSESRPVWILQTTLVSTEQKTAVINGRVVAEGGWISGARVIEIQPTWVRLRGEAGEFVIRQSKIALKKSAR